MQWVLWYWLSKSIENKTLIVCYSTFSQLIGAADLTTRNSWGTEPQTAIPVKKKISSAQSWRGFSRSWHIILFDIVVVYQPTTSFTQAFRSSDIDEGIQCVARMSWVAAFAVFVWRTTTCQMIQMLFTKCVKFTRIKQRDGKLAISLPDRNPCQTSRIPRCNLPPWSPTALDYLLACHWTHGPIMTAQMRMRQSKRGKLLCTLENRESNCAIVPESHIELRMSPNFSTIMAWCLKYIQSPFQFRKNGGSFSWEYFKLQ
jgi:hypothetical protein